MGYVRKFVEDKVYGGRERSVGVGDRDMGRDRDMGMDRERERGKKMPYYRRIMLEQEIVNRNGGFEE